MSHTLTVKAKFLDPKAVEATAKEMNCEFLRGEIKLFDGTKVNGLGVKLPGWRYAVAIDTATGEAKYDNYKGAWGHQSHLDKFTQLYATNKLTLEARRKGWMVQRKTQPSGNIELQITGM